jgi:pimeloyl-ACP methyl ester carboxylesterase
MKQRSSSVALHYIEGPENGSPLLLIHGNMGRLEAFTSIIPELTSSTHLFAVDLRGHGKSPRVAGAYTLEDHVNDITAFIKEKIQGPVILFGMSLGGMIGLMAAARFPDLIRGIIIGDSPLSKTTLYPILEQQRDFANRITHYLKTNQIDKLREELNNNFSAENFRSCDSDIITATFDRTNEMLKGFEMETLLPLIKCPLLIMRGDEKLGSMIQDVDIDKATQLAPQIIDIKIPDIGHSLLENKEIVLKELIQLIDHIESKKPTLPAAGIA